MKCKALIQKEFKRAKADSVWPMTTYGPTEFVGKFPECGGKITFCVRARVEDGCSCCGFPDVVIEFDCSRCKAPYFEDRFAMDRSASDYLTKLLNDKD